MVLHYRSILGATLLFFYLIMDDIHFLFGLPVYDGEMLFHELRHELLDVPEDNLVIPRFDGPVGVLLNGPIPKTLYFALFLSAAQHHNPRNVVEFDHLPEMVNGIFHGGLCSNVSAVRESSLCDTKITLM